MSETIEAPAQSSESAPPAQGSGQGENPSEFTSVAAQAPEPAVEGDPPPVEAEADAPSAEEKPPEPEAPDYTDIKLPDGLKLDDPILSKFLEAAKEKGVSRETAQAVIESVAPGVLEALQAPMAEWRQTQEGWLDQIRADAEIGGANLREVQTTIGRVLANPAFVSPEEAKVFREHMDLTGAGNSPAFVKTFYRMARALVEAGPVSAGRPAPVPRNPAEVLYPQQQRT